MDTPQRTTTDSGARAVERQAASAERRRMRELLDRSSLGPVPERRCVTIMHMASDAATQAADAGLIDRTRCISCGAKLHLERTYVTEFGLRRLHSKFWVAGW
jgi:hypothetical protein